MMGRMGYILFVVVLAFMYGVWKVWSRFEDGRTRRDDEPVCGHCEHYEWEHRLCRLEGCEKGCLCSCCPRYKEVKDE